jgi:hypothetical protein
MQLSSQSGSSQREQQFRPDNRLDGVLSPHLIAHCHSHPSRSHPVALFFLFLFRCLAIATYLLCGFFVSSYVFSVSRCLAGLGCCAWPGSESALINLARTQTVVVVVLLALDFWTVRNVSGRVLVGLRFWNQVDEDGTSFWVFEHRNVSHPRPEPFSIPPLFLDSSFGISGDCTAL